MVYKIRWEKVGYKAQIKSGRKWKSMPRNFKKLNRAKDYLRKMSNIPPYDFETLKSERKVRIIKIQKLKEVL
jgi:hypothetical protein